jgi:hypothetical protein
MPDFTAPVSGRYHVVSGHAPHLETDCDQNCPMHAAAPSKGLATRIEDEPTIVAFEFDVAAFTAALAEAWRRLREQLEPIVRAIGEALRPLIEFLEAHPELAEIQHEAEPPDCRHVCVGHGAPHECDGEATGLHAYSPSGREVPMCGPCIEAARAQREQPGLVDRYLADAQARGRDTRSVTLSREAVMIHSRHRDWPEQGSTCAHVCGPDPDHACLARATEYLTYPLPSGGTRRMPVCAPCHASETAETLAPPDPDAARAVRPDARADLVGHSGLTFTQWIDRRTREAINGRREHITEPHDFDREFVADADGWMPPITAIINQITGQQVLMDPPLRVKVDDLDRVIAEWQQRFAAEWNAEHPDRPV